MLTLDWFIILIVDSEFIGYKAPGIQDGYRSRMLAYGKQNITVECHQGFPVWAGKRDITLWRAYRILFLWDGLSIAKSRWVDSRL